MITKLISLLSREYRTSPAAKAKESPRRQRRTRRPELDPLEGRVVLSFIGSEKLVNPVTGYAQFDSDNASSANGTSVVVWTRQFGGTDYDIHAQRYGQYGEKVGGVIYVENSLLNSQNASVAMADNGTFAVSWTNSNSNGTSVIMVQRYSVTGTAIGGQTQVSNPTYDISSGYGLHDYASDVAISNGALVVAYSHGFSSSDVDVLARRYTTTATTTTDAGMISVATAGGGLNERTPSVAMNATGNFNIAYEVYNANDFDADVYMKRYSATGAFVQQHTISDLSTQYEAYASVAIDNAGNSVVAFQNPGIQARRISGTGVASGLITVRSNTSAVSNYIPSVALARVGGMFVVGYTTYSTSTGYSVGVTEVSATNGILAHLGPVAGNWGVSVSIDGFNRYVATYNKGSGTAQGVYSRRDFLS